jgi:flagellar basal-body rod protein FlgB
VKTLFDSFSTLEQGLAYQLRRHELLTSNVANAQTPGFQPQDLRFTLALDRAQQLTRTHAAHLNVGGGADAGHELFVDATVTPGNDGNGVSLERELAKMTANGIRFRALAEMVSRRLGLLHYAARDGQR